MKEKLRNLEKFFECLLFLIGERSRDQFAVFRLVAKVRQIIDSETRKKNFRNYFLNGNERVHHNNGQNCDI